MRLTHDSPGTDGFKGLLIPFFLCFGVYVRSLAPSITGGDGGELVAAAWGMGAAHPPGYPGFVLLGRIFCCLPLGDVAFRCNLLSGIAVSVALLLTGAVLLKLGIRLWLAAPLMVLVATGPLMWGIATAAEVYGPFLLVFSMAVLVGLQEGKRGLLGGVFLGALSLGFHYIGLALFPALAVRHAGKIRLDTRLVLTLALVFLLGLSSLLALPLMCLHDPLVNWGDPHSLTPFLKLVTRAQYKEVEIYPWSVESTTEQMRFLAGLLLKGYLWFGVVFIIFGLYAGYKRCPRYLAAWGVLFLSTAPGLMLYSNPVLDELKRHVMEVFFVVPYLLLAIPTGLGLEWAARGKRAGPAIARGLVILLCVTAGFRGYHQWPEQTRRHDTLALDYVRNLLVSVPRGSLLLSSGDSVTFPIWYLQATRWMGNRWLEKDRLICVSLPSLTYTWYPGHLCSHYPALDGLGELLASCGGTVDYDNLVALVIQAFRNRSRDGAVLSTKKLDRPPSSWRAVRWGLGERLLKDEKALPSDNITASAALSYTASLWPFFQLRSVENPPLASYVDRGLLITYRSFLYNLGTDFLSEKRYRESEIFLKRALELDEDYTHAWLNLGYLYSKTGHSSQALQHYAKVCGDKELGGQARNSRGAIYYAQGLMEKACQEYSLVLAADSDSLEALIGLGAIAFKREQWPEARNFWQKALVVDPGNKMVESNLAALDMLVGKKGH